MTVDVHALTGAYVLDAVTELEHRTFERHLAGCESCAREVAELRETTTRLALAATGTPPAHLRHQVLSRIGGVRQYRRRPPMTRLSTTAAAVLLVVCAALGVLGVRQHQTLDAAQHQATAMTTILRADDAQVIRQDVGAGRLTLVLSRSQDRMLLLADDLPPAPPGHTYQAWRIDTMFHPAGLLSIVDGHADLAMTGIGAATQIGLTVEPAGGSPHPTTPPVATLRLADPAGPAPVIVGVRPAPTSRSAVTPAGWPVPASARRGAGARSPCGR